MTLVARAREEESLTWRAEVQLKHGRQAGGRREAGVSSADKERWKNRHKGEGRGEKGEWEREQMSVSE